MSVLPARKGSLFLGCVSVPCRVSEGHTHTWHTQAHRHTDREVASAKSPSQRMRPLKN